MALAALIVSIVSLLGTVVLVVIRWPRVTVMLEQWTHDNCGTVTQRVRLVVANHGSEPVTVAKLELGVRPREGYDGRDLDYDFDLTHWPESVPEGESIPAEIPARGVRVWAYDEPQLSRFVTGDELVGRATTFKTFRLVPMFLRSNRTSAYKTWKSRQRVVRV
ncbi:hypothetical protein ACFUEJ_14940 [Gordonia sp. NPDC057258]|uniref:hypothetical protein n=1 Tax=unclassified Gordonia (in: high G+C Gram-positive bacteria) TaxID=2657482 RepID=UPI00362A202B